MKKTHAPKVLGYMLLLSAVITPRAWADNIAGCEVLIAETIEDEDTGGSALISSYRPAASFLSSVYDDEAGHVEEIDGHKIRAVFCQRRSAVPTLRDFPILETGTPLSLSQNFDSAESDLTLTRFIDGRFTATYSGPGLEAEEVAEFDEILEVFNFQPHNLGGKDETVSATIDEKIVEVETEEIAETVDETIVSTGGEIIDETVFELTDGAEETTSTVALDDSLIDGEEKLEDALSLNEDREEVGIDTPEEPIAQDETVLVSEKDAQDETTLDGAKEAQDIVIPSLKPTIVPTQSDAAEFDATCRIVTRDAFGLVNEIPLSASGLQNNLETSPAFILPLPSGMKMEAVKCARDSLTPGENDYKVARAGYPFYYLVKGDSAEEARAAALEFVGGKYRMNLLEGDFTDQELIDAKARILSFNDNISPRNDLEGPAE